MSCFINNIFITSEDDASFLELKWLYVWSLPPPEKSKKKNIYIKF